MDVRLQPTTEKLIIEVHDKAVESVKLRWAKVRWLRHEAGIRDAPLIIVLASSVAALYVADLKNAESRLSIDPGLHGYRPLLHPLPRALGAGQPRRLLKLRCPRPRRQEDHLKTHPSCPTLHLQPTVSKTIR